MKKILILFMLFLSGCRSISSVSYNRVTLDEICKEFHRTYHLNYLVEEIECYPANSNCQWIQFYDPNFPGFPVSFLYDYDLSVEDNLIKQSLFEDVKRNQSRIKFSEILRESLVKIFEQDVLVYINGISESEMIKFQDIRSTNVKDIFIATEFINDLDHYRNAIDVLDEIIHSDSAEKKTNIVLYLFSDLDEIEYEITLCGKGYSSESKEYGVCGTPFLLKENPDHRVKMTNHD